MGSWGNRTTKDLLAFMQGSMPPGNPGGLGEATYLNIAAFILDSNGARPGAEPLTAAASVGIRSIATGQPRLQQPACRPTLVVEDVGAADGPLGEDAPKPRSPQPPLEA